MVVNQSFNATAGAYKFNPGFQSDEEAIQNFVVRQRELESLVDTFRPGRRGRSTRPPRALIVAARGAGKTTLCRRMLAEIHRDESLADEWHPIFLGEESYSVTTPGEFFLECIFHLHERTQENDLKAEYDKALLIQGEENLLAHTLKILKGYARSKAKRLLIIVENLQIILDDQIGFGADELLKHLRNDRLFGVLATTVAQSGTDEGPDLHDFLKILLLPLDLSECHDLWKALTGYDVKKERIRPLQILTGGSPRLLHVLAEFMRKPSLSNLMGNLNLLIDQNTEYFKSHLDTLPALERKVFVALLDAWDPSTAKQVAEAARVDINTASSMLSRLASRGAVIKEQGKGRTAIYYAAERLFNIYYLMRRRSQPSGRVHALVSFMTEYYDRDELIDTAAIIAKEACAVVPARRADYHTAIDAIFSRQPKDVRARILERAPPEFTKPYLEHREVHGGDESSELRSVLSKAQRARENDNFDEALKILSSASQTFPNSLELWVQLILLRISAGDLDEAIADARNMRNAPEGESLSYALEGMALTYSGRRDAAKAAYKKALDIDADNVIAVGDLAVLYAENEETDKALELFYHANEIDSLSATQRVVYSTTLINEGKEEEAEQLLSKGGSEPEAYLVRRAHVSLLDRKGRQSEGIELLKRAAEDNGGWRNWADYGTFLFARSEKAEEADAALRKAVALGADDPVVFRSLAVNARNLGADKEALAKIAGELTGRLPTDPDAWLQASWIYRMIEADAEAERAIRTAIHHDGGCSAYVELGRLLQDEPGRGSEAKDAFEKAVATAEPHECRSSKALVDFLVHNGQEEEADQVLRKLLEKDGDCYCCTVAQAEISERAGDQKNARKWYETALNLNDRGVAALTGLANMVEGEEAKQLINRALAESPEDSRCFLARAKIIDEREEDRISDASRALEIDPAYIDAHLFLAILFASKGEVERSLVRLKSALDELSTRRELIPRFVDTAMAVASKVGGERVSALIKEHPQGSTLEPLSVALEILRGEKPVVAKEVMEVAEDIAKANDRKSK